MAYKNKEDQKACVKKHYEANKEIYKKRASTFSIEARKRNKNFIKNYLLLNPCVDCGESDVIVLEFDHVRGEKENNIANASNRAWSLKKIKEEISKCEVRCCNCHRRITHKRRLESHVV
jgi:hypothetical protein